MSLRPQSLIDVSKYIQEKAGVPASNMSIRAARSARGFHAGKSEIYGPNGQGDKDYSVKNPRNKAGLSEYSSAIDIKIAKPQLKALVAHLVAEGAAGNLLFEVIGPDSSGKANYWGHITGWQPNPHLAPASHAWHAHLGFWRDTENADRLAPFRSFYESPVVPAPDPAPPADPDVDPDAGPSIADIEALEAENARLAEVIARVRLAVA